MITNSTVLLNNPVWHALATEQAQFALGADRARRFLPEIGPFAAVEAANPAAFAQLAALIAPGEGIALVGTTPPSGAAWSLLRQPILRQMVYEGAPVEREAVSAGIVPLSSADIASMLELVSLTHPGPFERRTIELGRYVGIWQGGRLAAMGGERFHLPGYREISAVCTHPDFQRRGYARALVTYLIGKIQGEGDVPILHVVQGNDGAQALYESLGFRVRAELMLSVLKRQ